MPKSDTPHQDPDAALVVPAFAATHPAWLRLTHELGWYDARSQRNQHTYKRLKLAQLVLAVLIPVLSLAAGDAGRLLCALAGATIALLEGMQQMNQYATLWVSYRATAEHLKHEKFLFLSGAGPYRDLAEQPRLVQLAERVEERVSTEQANWVREVRSGGHGERDEPAKEGGQRDARPASVASP
jgi:hypothetical protein